MKNKDISELEDIQLEHPILTNDIPYEISP